MGTAHSSHEDENEASVMAEFEDAVGSGNNSERFPEYYRYPLAQDHHHREPRKRVVEASYSYNELAYGHKWAWCHASVVKASIKQVEVEARKQQPVVNIMHRLTARQWTGCTPYRKSCASTEILSNLSPTLYNKLDKSCNGITSEVILLKQAMDDGDWNETCTLTSRMAPRLVGDVNSASRRLERRVFCSSGGVSLLLRVFREPTFVRPRSAGLVQYLPPLYQRQYDVHLNPAASGEDTLAAMYYDARQLNQDNVTHKLAHCWNETLVILRELVYHMPEVCQEVLHSYHVAKYAKKTFCDPRHLPSLRKNHYYLDFVPWLFTLLAHDACFDSAAALIEEILSLQSQAVASTALDHSSPLSSTVLAGFWSGPLFCLADVPNFYQLAHAWSCRQMAHICRIFALLLFEPEDRHLMESPTVLKSMDLLLLRRERAARPLVTLPRRSASYVDENQSLTLDSTIMQHLIDLLRIMNYAPDLHRSGSYHLMAHYPWVGDTLLMLGLNELEDFCELDNLESLARQGLTTSNRLSTLGHVAGMFEALSVTVDHSNSQVAFASNNNNNQAAHLGQIINVLNAAQAAGVVMRGTAAAPLPLVNDWPARDDSAMTPIEAANELQFNALLLAPYQVEVLFVLCTLLGGRRKLDAQRLAMQYDLITVLDEMFDRLSWGTTSASSSSNNPMDEGGIHGPGCECNPESALRVQYLRLLHNFCDRDCDNYRGRRLLLSQDERNFIFENTQECRPIHSKGLLSKVIDAFMNEPDDSTYNFWLASCIESYLRGSSPPEQVFVAQSGLLTFLLKDILTDRVHCAGSLQTTFDLLGEICKGNLPNVNTMLQALVTDVDSSFSKLMTIAATNLVDSNVFLRSLLITVERFAYNDSSESFHLDRTFLTHSWWDYNPTILAKGLSQPTPSELQQDEAAVSDWFLPNSRRRKLVNFAHQQSCNSSGWIFAAENDCHPINDHVSRLEWFLVANQSRLLRDLLHVVDLDSINHENICCLNTAVVVAIFAHRRSQLVDVVEQLSESSEILENFRQLLWFWMEYYSHRGRDRLSLEFSSHVRFHEWVTVVRKLLSPLLIKANNVARPLPTSPYKRPPRSLEGRWRSE